MYNLRLNSVCTSKAKDKMKISFRSDCSALPYISTGVEGIILAIFRRTNGQKFSHEFKGFMDDIGATT
jgi:hypothetical protein